MAKMAAAGYVRQLFVLVHGLHGDPGDFDFLTRQIRARFGDAAVVIAPRNRLLETHEGVERCAERVLDATLAALRAHEDVAALSVVGHSLGGLIGRYLIGLLETHGVLARVRPLVFASLASPHLGSRQHARVWPSVLADKFAELGLQRTGRQLFLLDVPGVEGQSEEPASDDEEGEAKGESRRREARDAQGAVDKDQSGEAGAPSMEDSDACLLQLTQGPFVAGLARFHVRAAYANSRGDYSVHYSTAALRARNPFAAIADHNALPRVAGYSTIIDYAAFRANESNAEAVARAERGVPLSGRKDAYARAVQLMFRRLTALEWRRVDVVGRPLLAHTDIVVKREWLNAFGAPTVAHLVHETLLPAAPEPS
jgi:pimeloyl-ACP methyl ester carboxylesterase